MYRNRVQQHGFQSYSTEQQPSLVKAGSVVCVCAMGFSATATSTAQWQANVYNIAAQNAIITVRRARQYRTLISSNGAWRWN